MNTLKLRRAFDTKEFGKVYRTAVEKRGVERLLAIRWSAQGKSPCEVAEILGRHVGTIRKWIKLFNEGGYERLEYRHSGSRVGKLTAEHEGKLSRWLREGRPGGGGWTLSALSEKLLQECAVQISQQQISEKIYRMELSHLISRPRRKRLINSLYKTRKAGR